MTKEGHGIVFDSDGSYIINKRSGETIALNVRDGAYVFNLWAPAAQQRNSVIRTHNRYSVLGEVNDSIFNKQNLF